MRGNTISTYNEYQQQALTTAIYPVDREVDYTIVGLGSEIGELAEVYAEAKKGFYGKLNGTDTKEALSECGDIQWYVAATADALGLQLDWVLQQVNTELHHVSKGLTLVDMVVAHGKIQGILKKSIRDNEGFLTKDHDERIAEELCHIWNHTAQFIYLLGGTEAGVMAANLNKLADRKARGVLQGSGNNR
jgi:NTP pyrophosphatase (non-canonical NTP hydrolase)